MTTANVIEYANHGLVIHTAPLTNKQNHMNLFIHSRFVDTILNDMQAFFFLFCCFLFTTELQRVKKTSSRLVRDRNKLGQTLHSVWSKVTGHNIRCEATMNKISKINVSLSDCVLLCSTTIAMIGLFCDLHFKFPLLPIMMDMSSFRFITGPLFSLYFFFFAFAGSTQWKNTFLLRLHSRAYLHKHIVCDYGVGIPA